MRPWKKPKSDLLIFEAALTWFPCYHFMSYIILYIYILQRNHGLIRIYFSVCTEFPHIKKTALTIDYRPDFSMATDRTANYTDRRTIFIHLSGGYICIYIYVHIHTDDTSMYIMCIYIYIYTNTDISLYISKLFLLILASWSGGGSRCAWRWTGHHQGRWQGDIIQHWDLMAYSSGYADMCIDID